MAWSFNSASPIYLQICDRVLEDILGGKYENTKKIESVRELAAIAGVNPNTVQRAMVALEESGAVSTTTGDGRYVTENTEILNSLRRAEAEKAALGFAEKVKKLAISERDAKEILSRCFERLEDNPKKGTDWQWKTIF